MSECKLTKEIFFKKYPKCRELLEKSDLNWETLGNIYIDYMNRRKFLESTGRSVVESLRDADHVHSVRYRTKDPYHVIEKIIRKNNDYMGISVDNYRSMITDLVGVRVLHLFKEDWQTIHRYINNYWKVHEQFVYYRKGDSSEYLQTYKQEELEEREHPFGYRSVHHIIKAGPEKEPHYVEIQVRTIFEEGWSEIDHKIRYPYDLGNVTYSEFLKIMNRLAGTADEMATFICELKRGEDSKAEQVTNIRGRQENALQSLVAFVEGMKPEIGAKLEKHLDDFVGTTGLQLRVLKENIVLRENFDGFDDWKQLKKGVVVHDKKKQRTGSGCLRKEGFSDPHGGYRELGENINGGFTLRCWIYRPSKKAEPKQGGEADRVAVEDADFNGYGFSIGHASKCAWIERRDGARASIISDKSDLPEIKDKWYQVEFSVTKEGKLELTMRKEDGKQILKISGASDSTYKSFSRVAVHGGWPYYIDEIVLEKVE